MTVFRTAFARLAVLSWLVSLVAGCSVPVAQETPQRFFFPPFPGQPKIEYIKPYYSTQDLRPLEKGFVTKFITGEELPQLIFSSPVDVASDSKGRVFVTDSTKQQVMVLDQVNHELRFLKAPRTDVEGNRSFGIPFGVAVDSDGRVYISDVLSQTVDVFDVNEQYLFSIKDPDLTRPTGLAVDSLNKKIYVADTPSHHVVVFDLQGKVIGKIGNRGSELGQFNYPTDVGVDQAGNLYVLDSLNARVEVFDADGHAKFAFGERGTADGSFQMAKGLAVAPTGQVYVTDGLGHKLLVFSLEGEFLLRIGSKSRVQSGVSPGGFYLPRGVDVDRNGAIWVADSMNRMVHQFQFLTEKYLQEHPLQ